MKKTGGLVVCSASAAKHVISKQNHAKLLFVCDAIADKRLIACSVNNDGTLESTDGWQKIAFVGKWKGHRAGTFELTTQDLEQIVTNFENSPLGEIVVDFEHATLYGDQAPAAGWLQELKVENDELFGRIEWLDDTKEMIKSKKYKYLSPVLVPHTLDQESGEDIGWTLHSVALTNKPFFEELDEVKVNKNTQVQKKEENILDEKTKKEIEDLKTENQELRAAKAEQQIDTAIAAKKVHPDQKESLLAFSKKDPEGFEAFLEAAKPIASAPGEDDMFAGSQSADGGREQYDVLELGGFNQ